MRAWWRSLGWPRISLLALCIGLLAVTGAELTPQEPMAYNQFSAAPPSERADAGKSPGFVMPPISAFAQVQARPLFSQTRRPGAPAGSLPASASFTLMAIVISAEDRHALLASGQPPKVVRVNEGEELGGWTVETILPNAVIVRRADLREEVKAKEAKKSTAEKPVSAVSAVTSAMHDTAQPRKSHDE